MGHYQAYANGTWWIFYLFQRSFCTKSKFPTRCAAKRVDQRSHSRNKIVVLHCKIVVFLRFTNFTVLLNSGNNTLSLRYVLHLSTALKEMMDLTADLEPNGDKMSKF